LRFRFADMTYQWFTRNGKRKGPKKKGQKKKTRGKGSRKELGYGAQDLILPGRNREDNLVLTLIERVRGVLSS